MVSEHSSALRFSMVNETFTDHISVEDRGLAYGDGLFESMLYQRKKIPLLEKHLARLLAACKILKIDVSERVLISRLQLFIENLQRLSNVDAFERAKIKLIVTRGNGGEGCYPSREARPPTTVISAAPLKTSGSESKVQLTTAQFPLASMVSIVGLKHLSRIPYIVSAGSKYNGQNEIVFFDDEKRFIETMHHNIFFIGRDTVFTPRLNGSGVAGIARALIMHEIADYLKIEVIEREISRENLNEFDVCFIANAVRGLREVAAIDDHRFSSSPLFSRVNTAFDHYVESKI